MGRTFMEFGRRERWVGRVRHKVKLDHERQLKRPLEHDQVRVRLI
jgi:hypothetical protein